MRDDHRPLRIGHRADAIKAFLVTCADALVLTQMLMPGPDNKLLDETTRLSAVPHAAAQLATPD